jgi:hypothetical protein
MSTGFFTFFQVFFEGRDKPRKIHGFFKRLFASCLITNSYNKSPIVADFKAGARHALPQPAFFEKILFQAFQLTVEQLTSHFNQAKNDIGTNGRIGMSDAFAEGVLAGARLAVEVAQAAGMGMGRCPFREAARAEEVAVIRKQLFETGAGHVGQFEFRFFRSAGGLAAFDNVLLAGTRGLHHLIISAIALAEEAATEIYGGVIYNLGFLVGEKFLVAAMLGNEGRQGRKGRKGF